MRRGDQGRDGHDAAIQIPGAMVSHPCPHRAGLFGSTGCQIYDNLAGKLLLYGFQNMAGGIIIQYAYNQEGLAAMASAISVAPEAQAYKLSGFSGVRFQTVVTYPLCKKVRASLEPMEPNPITVTEGRMELFAFAS